MFDEIRINQNAFEFVTRGRCKKVNKITNESITFAIKQLAYFSTLQCPLAATIKVCWSIVNEGSINHLQLSKTPHSK